MILHRRSTNPISDHQRELDDWECLGAEVRVVFREFGAGSERTSCFEIRLGWEDVETIVNAMADKGHVSAIRVRKALKLADAVEDIAQISNPRLAQS